MKFNTTTLAGVHLIELEKKEDERGYFARTFDEAAFAQLGFPFRIVQSSTSFNATRGTLRGMHYQVPPHAEAKIVRCTRGALFDVVLDLRADSPTFKKWVSFDLTADNGRTLYIPEGCAHGFQTLEDGTEVLYSMNAPYVADAARGIRFDDPAFAIEWPEAERIISEKDRAYPNWA